MPLFRLPAGVLAASLLAVASVQADPAPDAKLPAKLPICGLAPSKIVPDLCVYRYRVSTPSPECQAFFDQGFGYFYSYVWMEAARSFETALQYDPDCATGLVGTEPSAGALGQAATHQGAAEGRRAARQGQPARTAADPGPNAGEGPVPGVGDADAAQGAAIATIDNMLAAVRRR